MFAALIISQALTTQTPVLPPGWLKGCATHEITNCEISKVAWEDIYLLNVAVNHIIKPKPDTVGEVESWRVFPAEGDCSDYTVSKRAVLLAWGVDPQAITVELGEHYREEQWRRHMNLRVRLADGYWILDSVRDMPYRPEQATRPYPWRSIASQPTTRGVWTQPED